MKAVFSTIIFLCISLFSFSFSPIQKGQDTIIYSNEDFIILNDSTLISGQNFSVKYTNNGRNFTLEDGRLFNDSKVIAYQYNYKYFAKNPYRYFIKCIKKGFISHYKISKTFNPGSKYASTVTLEFIQKRNGPLEVYSTESIKKFLADDPELLTKMQILESKHEKQQLTDGMHFAAYLIGFFGIVLTYLGFFGKEKSDVKNKVPGIVLSSIAALLLLGGFVISPFTSKNQKKILKQYTKKHDNITKTKK